MPVSLNIVPCLWFDDEAEAAAKFYTSVFPDSKIVELSHYPDAGREHHGREPGAVMTVVFDLNGHRFTALNGGPHFKFTEAVSFMVMCDTQAEVDTYWQKLGDGGDPKAQQCGWLKDKFGLSWQIVPRVLMEMIKDPMSAGGKRAFLAMMHMKKLDIASLEKAYQG